MAAIISGQVRAVPASPRTRAAASRALSFLGLAAALSVLGLRAAFGVCVFFLAVMMFLLECLGWCYQAVRPSPCPSRAGVTSAGARDQANPERNSSRPAG